jgi:hypothetical protein
MDAKQLAVAADKECIGLRSHLSEDVCIKIGMAYIAQWLYGNDESCRAAAATTACEAIEILRDMWRDDFGTAAAR